MQEVHIGKTQASVAKIKLYKVNVTKKRRGYTFPDAKVNAKVTKRTQWETIQGGWIYKGKSRTYFTDKLK